MLIRTWKKTEIPDVPVGAHVQCFDGTYWPLSSHTESCVNRHQ